MTSDPSDPLLVAETGDLPPEPLPKQPKKRGVPKGHKSKGRKRGRKSKWGKVNPSKVAHAMIKLGATEQQVAETIGVTADCLSEWKSQKKELNRAIVSAKQKRCIEVERALYLRAKGYKHRATKILVVDGAVRKVPYTEHYPPDTPACVHFLRHQDPENWRDKPAEIVASATLTSPDGTTSVFNIGVRAEDLPC
jgi:hypothetical protein